MITVQSSHRFALYHRKRDTHSCFEVITRAAAEREIKVSSQLAMCVFLQAFIYSRPGINLNRPLGLLQFNTEQNSFVFASSNNQIMAD